MTEPTIRVILLAAINGLMPVFTFARPAIAPPQALWEIGKFDQSSREFNTRANFANPNCSPTFIVGQSNNKDWLAFQPGSKVITAGAPPHPSKWNSTLTLLGVAYVGAQIPCNAVGNSEVAQLLHRHTRNILSWSRT